MTLFNATNILSLLVIWLALTGCQRPPAPRNVARMNLFSDPGTLDPRQVNEIVGRNVALMLYEGLTRINADNCPQLALAESITVSPNGLEVTIKLRTSQWANGEPLVAADFITTWQEVLSPHFPSTYAYQLYVIKNARAIKSGELPREALGVSELDAHTLIVTLEHPVPYLLDLFACPSFFPYHSEGCSNGPFVLESWKPDQQLNLRKNPLFWDADTVGLDRLELPMIESENTSLFMFEQGALDYIGLPFFLIPLEAIDNLRAQGTLHTHDVAGIYWFKLNTTHPVLANAKVRRALSMALSRQALVDFVTRGVHATASGALPDCLRKHTSPLIAKDGNWEARLMLAEGLDELGLTLEQIKPLELSFNNCTDHLKFAASAQQQWEQTLGLRITLQAREWHDHLSHIAEGDYTIARHGWQANFADPIDVLQPFATTGPLNATGWNHPEFQALVTAAQYESNPFARARLLAEAEALLVKEAPVIPLFSYRYPYCINPNLYGVVCSELATVDFRWARFAQMSPK